MTFSDIHTIMFTFFHLLSLIKASLFSCFPFQITCTLLLLSPSSQWTLSSFLLSHVIHSHLKTWKYAALAGTHYSRCRSAACLALHLQRTNLCIAEVTCVCHHHDNNILGLLLGEMCLKLLHANILTILTP